MNRVEIEEKVKAFLIDELEIDEEKIFPEAKLKDDMGIDSLDFVDIVVIVERNFGFKIKAEENVKYQIKFIVTKKDFDRSIVCKDYPMDPEKYTRRLPVIPESIGITALSVDGCSASYTLKEDDLYVRALIISDKKTEYDGLFYPETEQAWTQPLANGK